MMSTSQEKSEKREGVDMEGIEIAVIWWGALFGRCQDNFLLHRGRQANGQQHVFPH